MCGGVQVRGTFPCNSKLGTRFDMNGHLHAPADLTLDQSVSICFIGSWIGPKAYEGAAGKRTFSAFPLIEIRLLFVQPGS